jgi:eukaryotic-like serine/threonine-protein kinase
MEISRKRADFKYRAFISYSHQDEGWALWLHKSLETYRVPPHVAGTEMASGIIPRRLSLIFSDRAELPSASDLQRKVSDALRQSANLIVIVRHMRPSRTTSMRKSPLSGA